MLRHRFFCPHPTTSIRSRSWLVGAQYFAPLQADCAHTFITMWMLLAISKKVVRHRSADLPGQADGNISPALLTQRQHRITGERQRAPPSAPSAPRSPTAPPPSQRTAAPTPAPPSEHTHLESPCRRAAAHGKPPFITQHTECSGSHRCTAHTARTRALFSGDNRLEGV